MDEDKLNVFVKDFVDRNKKEELEVLWSFVFSGCKTGFEKYTDEAKEHFAKIFKQSLEIKYGDSDPWRIISRVIKPIEKDFGGLDAKYLDSERNMIAQALLSNNADGILIDDLKRRIKELKEDDKEVLDLVLGFIKIKKSDILWYDAIERKIKFAGLEVGSNCYSNEIRKLLHDLKGIDKNSDELTHILVTNGFILSPYITSAGNTSKRLIIPLFLLETYTENFLPTALLSKINNWQEKVEEEIEKAEQKQELEEQEIGCDSWFKSREKEKAQKQLEDKLNSYLSELIKNKDFETGTNVWQLLH